MGLLAESVAQGLCLGLQSTGGILIKSLFSLGRTAALQKEVSYIIVLGRTDTSLDYCL